MDTTLSFLWFMLGSFALAIVPNQIAVQGTTVYLHRIVTHRSAKVRKVIAFLWRLGIWLTTGIIIRVWTAIHRKHHAHTDKDEGEGKRDPHSPYLEGFWSIQFWNVLYYRKESKQPGLLQDFAKDIKVDAFDRWFFDRPILGLGLGVTILLTVGFGLNNHFLWLDTGNFWLNGITGAGMGFTGALIHAVGYVFFQSSSVNGLCHTPHRFGYQYTNETQAVTTFNNWFVALLTGGEGLHHNHHWMAMSARFARTRLELLVDSGWWIIWTLKQFGLAYDVKVAPLLA